MACWQRFVIRFDRLSLSCRSTYRYSFFSINYRLHNSKKLLVVHVYYRRRRRGGGHSDPEIRGGGQAPWTPPLDPPLC